MSEKTERRIAVIPARFQSERFPGKLLYPIAGKPLIQWTYENALRCPELEEVWVATDDEAIQKVVEAFGGQVILTPHFPSGSDRVAYALDHIPGIQDGDIVLNIQGDEPCVRPETLATLLKDMRERPEVKMGTVAVALGPQDDPSDSSLVKCVLSQDGYALYFSRSCIPFDRARSRESNPSQAQVQMGLKGAIYGHLGIYSFRAAFLREYSKLPQTPLQMAEDLEQLKVLEHGYRLKVSLVDDRACGVDVPEDVEKVEPILCKRSTFSSPEA